ncbi:MAG TPA: hypothetical protein DHW36_15725 [Thalassospira sp.]|nr:hypothetical protein [Thalassospira sp.]|tara:strand:+ start:1208 stop:1789 length:582 start_codon:yes stop_codon:yes gene_type:complete
MRTFRPAVIISTIAVFLACFDTFVKPVSAVTLGLLALAALPWAMPFIRNSGIPIDSINFPWMTIRLKTLEQITEQAQQENLLAEPKHKYSFEEIYDSDPHLALAGLRIEIERIIRKLADVNTLARSPSLRETMFLLRDQGTISEEQLGLMMRLMPELNKAAHARDIEQPVHHWIIQVGPKLLAGLEEMLPTED